MPAVFLTLCKCIGWPASISVCAVHTAGCSNLEHRCSATNGGVLDAHMPRTCLDDNNHSLAPHVGASGKHVLKHVVAQTQQSIRL